MMMFACNSLVMIFTEKVGRTKSRTQEVREGWKETSGGAGERSV